MSATPRLLLLLPLTAGLVGVAVFGYYALVDWHALLSAYGHYETVAQHSSDLRTLMVADADQNIHRINLFADGVWALLSAILATVELSGMLVGRRGPE